MFNFISVFFSFLISPLEQFETFRTIIFKTVVKSEEDLDFYVIDLLLITLLIILSLLLIVTFYKKLVFNKIKKLQFYIIEIVRNLYVSIFVEIRKENKKILIFLFLTVFFCNIAGMIPFTFTVTSAFCFTLYLAFYNFVYNNLFFAKIQKWKSFTIILPSKNIYWIAPILILIETISYNAKVLSLSLRLFANMVAGHLMLKILAIFFADLFNQIYFPFFITNMFIYISIFVIIMLEILLSFLQAYVFTLLTILYTKEVRS